MKKIFILTMTAIIISMPLYGAVNLTNSSIKNTNNSIENFSTQDFTHNVLIEYISRSTCPYCPTASDQLHSIYNSGDYNFYYVTFVTDKMGQLPGSAISRVYNRLKELGVEYVPDVYFDGGYRKITGKQDDEQPYRNAIQQSGEREVADIDIDLKVDWIGIANTIRIKVTVQNNEPSGFKGKIRIYITEIDSRWTYSQDKKYHYGVLDIPYDNTLAIVKQTMKSKQQIQYQPFDSTHKISKLWSGDIKKNNCMVIVAVFDKNTDRAVQVASARPSTSDEKSSQSFFMTNIISLRFFEKFLNKFPVINYIFNL